MGMLVLLVQMANTGIQLQIPVHALLVNIGIVIAA
jgi:hypothetical protein